MGFRFLHTADWQLGRPFARFEPELAGRLQDQRVQVITRIADVARKNGARHVLVAGDVWDQEVPSDAALRRPMDRMAEATDIRWWLLPGNHDPAGPESLWQRLSRLGMAANVTPLLEAIPVEIEAGTWVLPAPWHTKRPGRDLTASLNSMTTPPDAVRIGLAHGSVQGFGSSGDDAAVIDPDRARAAGLAYLALGDWHGTREAGRRAWYAGTPEPDRFRNNDQGQVLVVDTVKPQAPAVVRTGHFDWRMEAFELGGAMAVEEIANALFPPGRSLDTTLLKLSLAGRAGLAELHALDTEIERERARLAHFEDNRDALRVSTTEDDLDAILGEGLLRRAADRLVALQADGDRSDAADALRLLDGFVRS